MNTFIFDFDGVVVDSELYWPEVADVGFAAMAPELVNDPVNHMGMTSYDMYELLKKEYNFTMSEEEYAQRISAMAESVYAKSKLLDGFLQFLDSVQEKAAHIAIGSSSQKKWIVKVLADKNLDGVFSPIITADDIERGQGKPRPGIYLKVAEELGVKPEDCVVLEDSKNGVQAGLSAGMYTIGLTHLGHGQDVSAANLVVNSFSEIPLTELFNH